MYRQLFGKFCGNRFAHLCWTRRLLHSTVKCFPTAAPVPCLSKLRLTPVHFSQQSPLYSSKCSPVCWSCDKPLMDADSPFCECGVVLPSRASDHFELFGLPRAFPTNDKLLLARFRQLQSKLHPDKFGGRDQKEQDISADVSSLVNEAYKTLSTSLSRSLYLLDLAGRGIGEGEDSPVMDQEFLMEVMEENEAIESAERGLNSDGLNELMEKVKGSQKRLVASIETAFGKGNIEEARELTLKLRYYVNMEEKIKEKLVS